jgi:hypothetical protein
LVLHPEKTKIVYCKDAKRRGDFPIISFDFLGFQFRARKTMCRQGTKRIFTRGLPTSALDGDISIEKSDRSFAIVTPTCLPDLARCELLAESLDRSAPAVPNYLIVDRRDRSAFNHLAVC